MPQAKEKNLAASLWDSLSSVRITIFLLILLAVASIFGTVIPQNASPEEYLQVYKMATYRILAILGFLDMYHAGWFFFLLGILGLNLVACSLKRFRTIRNVFARPEIRLRDGQWKGMNPVWKINQPSPPENALPSVQKAIGRVFASARVEESGGSYHLFAEKGRYSRLGFYCIHLSILVIMAGALIGLYFGFRGYINIAEGETADRVVFRNGQSRPLGFQVRLDRFNVSFYPSGAPQEFKSTVTILDPQKPGVSEPIRVNHPLTHKGISFYQASYGLTSVEKVVLGIQDLTTGQEVSVPARMGARVGIPGTSATFVLSRFLSDFQGGGPAFQIILAEPNKGMDSFWILQRHPEFSAGRPGRYVFRVKEMDPKYYSGLQVTRDPGVWVVWTGCLLLIAGFYLSFFMVHRRVWARVTQKKGGALVEISGASHRNRLEFEKELEKIAEALKTPVSPVGEVMQKAERST